MAIAAHFDKNYRPNVAETLEFLLLETTNPPVILDITGATFLMQVRSRTKENTVLVEASTANGKITIGSVDAEYEGIPLTGDGILVDLTAADTLTIYQGTTADFASTDIEMTLPSEEPKIVIDLSLIPFISDTRNFDVIC